MERLNLRLVEYFVAVAEELHFGRATERLHIAQPSLSQQVRRLEDRLGVTLLERTSRRVELTAAGETLLREGRRTLAQARQAVQATRAAGAERWDGLRREHRQHLQCSPVGPPARTSPASAPPRRPCPPGDEGTYADISIDEHTFYAASWGSTSWPGRRG